MSIKTSYQRHFLRYELLFSIFITLLIVLLLETLIGTSKLDCFLFGIRKEVYSTLASITGALLGFIITAISIVIVFAQSPRFELIRKSEHYPTLYKVFIFAIKYLAIATGLSILGLVIDKDYSPNHWLLYLVIWGILATTFSLGRCVWVLEKMISVVTKKEED